MARLLDQEDDVMVQGEKFEEEDADVLDSTDDQPVRQKGRGGGGGGKNSVIIIAIVIGVIAVIVVGVFGVMKLAPTLSGSSEEETEEWTEPPFEYMDTEIEALRDNGYTGDEIEQYEYESVPADILIDEAKAKRESMYEEEMAPYKDSTSDEFKELQSMTWLGGEEFTFNAKDVSNWQRKGSTLNLDYKKVPTHGYQCFLRIEMRKANPEKGIEAGYCFMYVDPIRYAELSDEGNINVQVNYYFIEETRTSIITDIHEVRTTDN